MKYYKITGPNGEPLHGGSGNWHLPKGNRPGKWMPKIDDIVPCESGYHLVEAKDILEWLTPNCVVWEAEHKGKMQDAGNKVVVQQARLIRKAKTWTFTENALFIADCAEHVEHIYAKCTNNDDGAKKLIQIQRDFANGKINQHEYDIQRAAALSAAWDAARNAAWDAEKEWQINKLLEYLGLGD